MANGKRPPTGLVRLRGPKQWSDRDRLRLSYRLENQRPSRKWLQLTKINKISLFQLFALLTVGEFFQKVIKKRQQTNFL